MRKIILASGSPRRKEILELLGLEFEIAESLYDEDLVQTDDPVELVEELALQKALAVAKRYPDAIVIGGDTTVSLGSESLGKASSRDEAKRIFSKLLGKTHKVVTGVAVVDSLSGEYAVMSEAGEVTFKKGSQAEIDKYVEEEKNWRGFAGAYALQGGASKFALNHTGTLSAIIGMPIATTVELLEQMGIEVEANPVQVEYDLLGMKVGIT